MYMLVLKVLGGSTVVKVRIDPAIHPGSTFCFLTLPF